MITVVVAFVPFEMLPIGIVDCDALQPEGRENVRFECLAAPVPVLLNVMFNGMVAPCAKVMFDSVIEEIFDVTFTVVAPVTLNTTGEENVVRPELSVAFMTIV